MKLPSIQLYPGDWLRDAVSGCSLAAQGLWLRMMFLAHDSDRYGYLAQNGTPLSSEHIARRCGTPLDQYVTLLAELDAAGVPSRTPDGIIYSRRMVKDAKERAGNKRRQQRFRDNRRVTPPVTQLSEGEDEVETVVPPVLGRGSGKGCAEALSVVRSALCAMFRRDPQEPWGYVEEHALVQVAKRPNAVTELEELKKFRLTGDFFPQSIDSLLANWAKTLDRSRNQAPKQPKVAQPPTNGADTVKFNGEYDRVLKRMDVIRSQYADHQTWAKGDREEFQKLRTRKKELQTILGITV